MKMKKISTSIEVEIPFFDIDAMDVTWHGHYVKYFAQARWALMAQLGYDLAQMRTSGYAWPIVKLDIKYVQPSYFRQQLRVEAILVEWENRLKINYRIRDKNSDTLITKGSTIQMALKPDSMETCFVLPKVFTDKVEAYPCED